MTDTSDDENIAQVQSIVRSVSPLLAAVHPNVAGCVLGELVGFYFAGHNPRHRDMVRKMFDEMVARVVDVIDTQADRPWRQQ